MIIRDQFDPVLRKEINKKKHVAVIPVGSIEQHGPHLPVSTDSDIVSEIASQVCKKCDFLLLPTITYGVSFEHFPFFNLSIKKSSLTLILEDLCVSLFDNNISKVIILNGHHGNLEALKRFEKRINKKLKKSKVSIFSYWHYLEQDFDHAGFVETSLMLAISNNVKMNKAKKGLITKNLNKKQISRINKIALKSFPKATKNGVWGDPLTATKRDGIKILSEIVRNLSKVCQT